MIYEDPITGDVTITLLNGHQHKLDARLIDMHGGVGPCLDRLGLNEMIDHQPIPVMQDGQPVGTLPASFDWQSAPRHTDLMYQPHRTDFRREGDTWIACPSLGPGDLEAFVEFQPPAGQRRRTFDPATIEREQQP